MRALALDVACEIHPLNNLRVLRYLVRDLKVSEDDKDRWYRHWVETGLEVVERQLAAQPGTYLPRRHADPRRLLLVPQIFNAQRFECRTRPRAAGDARVRSLHGAARVQQTQPQCPCRVPRRDRSDCAAPGAVRLAPAWTGAMSATRRARR